MNWRGDWPPPSRPRPVDGGLKARSKRGAIGEQWWSQRFLAVLESFGMASRLARGRNYARRGQVIGFDLAPGRVTARVQGSRTAPYRVSITVAPLTDAQWERVEAELAAQALFRARLLAGEMPAEIEDAFAGCGTPLFPGSARDLVMSCSCPDWGMPCKHLAAVCYLLAEAFDEDPFAMLAWRGRSREELLARLRALAAGGPGRVGPDIGAAPVIDVADRPLAECLDEFWSPGLPPARLRTLPATAGGRPDLLLRAFPPPEVTVRAKSLPAVLAPAYERMAADPLTQAGPADGAPGADLP